MADVLEPIRKARTELTKEVTAVETKLAPLYSQREKHVLAAEKERQEAKRINEKIMRIEEAELVPVRNQLATVARALGAKSLSDA